MKKQSVYLSTRWCTIAHLKKNSIMVQIKLPLILGQRNVASFLSDLNPLHSEKLSVNHLKKSLQKVWADIPQKKIHTAVEAFRSRLEKVIDANGG